MTKQKVSCAKLQSQTSNNNISTFLPLSYWYLVERRWLNTDKEDVQKSVAICFVSFCPDRPFLSLFCLVLSRSDPGNNATWRKYKTIVSSYSQKSFVCLWLDNIQSWTINLGWSVWWSVGFNANFNTKKLPFETVFLLAGQSLNQRKVFLYFRKNLTPIWIFKIMWR